MKLKTPERPNFSRSAKLCDQNLYIDSHYCFEQLKGYTSSNKKLSKKDNQNYFFKSVSRQKRGNFRFKIPQNKGEFSYYPEYNNLKPTSPRWIFSKKQKYVNQKFQQYQFCHKNPLIRQNQQTQMKATLSMKILKKDKVKMIGSKSFLSTSGDLSKNYSILDPRNISPSGFFSQSKIKAPRYLSKSDLNKIQSQEDQRKYQQRLKSNQKGYIQFAKQKLRPSNIIRKSFEKVQKIYNHQDQFNNFTMTNFPIKPEYHINFDKHLQRPEIYSSRLGPNPEIVDINFTRKKDSNINYKLSTYRDKIITKFDRVQPYPNTRLDIDLPIQKLSGRINMDKVIGRNDQLFPIVDPAIKKSGDKQIKSIVKKI